MSPVSSTSTTAETNATLGRQAAASTFWAYLSFMCGKGLVFISTLILARLLTPDQFGLIGYCMIAIQYLDILNGFGVDSALISRRDKAEEAANIAFVASIGSSLLMFACAWIAAPYVAEFFHASQVTLLLRVLSVTLIIDSIGAVPNALIQRQLRFKAKMAPELGRGIAKGVLSLLFAWQGFGVWSLVWGQVAGELTSTVALWIMVPWRPTRRFDPEVNREVLTFGGHIISVGIVGALLANIDYLIVGRSLGALALGLYTLAYRIPELVIRNTNYVVARVTFPLLAKVQHQPERLRSVFLGFLRYLAIFAFPAGVGIALIAPAFFSTFYSEEWQPAAVAMQLVALALAISSIGHLPGVIYKSINRPGILNVTSFVKLIVVAALLLVAVHWGITGVAAGQVIFAVFSVVLDMVVVMRILHIRTNALIHELVPALVATTAMAAIAGALTLVLPESGVMTLLALMGSGAAVYLSSLLLVSRETYVRARTILRSAGARA